MDVNEIYSKAIAALDNEDWEDVFKLACALSEKLDRFSVPKITGFVQIDEEMARAFVRAVKTLCVFD
jgi:hypothetical protein